MRKRRLGRHVRVIPGDFTEDAGANAAQQLLDGGELPTAIFAANDLVAAGLLGVLDRAGVDVPADVSIIGYDNIAIAHLAHFSLSTIDQPRTQMGRLALQLLLDRREHRRRSVMRLIEPTLIVRSTTAPPRAEGVELAASAA
jgi:DNA-binding LacI/PurR family transcriptional regulator